MMNFIRDQKLKFVKHNIMCGILLNGGETGDVKLLLKKFKKHLDHIWFESLKMN